MSTLLRFVLASTFIVFSCMGAQAQTYPSKPVHIVVAAPPGGGTDFLARWIGTRWTEAHGQSVIVDNVSGANGNIGAAQVARSRPDGYTLMMSFVGTQAINPGIYRKVSYVPQQHLDAIAKVATYPFVIAVNGQSAIRSLPDLITTAKTRPVSYASAGVGSGGHLTGAMFAQQTGASLNHIPYKGSAPAAADVAGGQVDVLFDTLATAAPLIKGGRLRALAVTSPNRLPQFPDVPTVKELGLPGMVTEGWYGIFTPKGAPPEVVQSISSAVNKIIATQAYKESVSTVGYFAAPPNTPTEFQMFVSAETAKWGAFTKAANITAD
jgi:tripartite-type tricarboxylate transporter receptor subunit TctC